jgi:hypothetical protein
MAWPGCTDPGKTKLLTGPWSICTPTHTHTLKNRVLTHRRSE